MIICAVIIVVLVAFDQVTKLVAAGVLKGGESTVVIDGVFRFTYVENRGAAFGMLDNHRWVFMALSTIAILLLVFYLFRHRPENKFLRIALSLVIGGGIGNMIDRVRLGYVIDFIDFYAFPKLWPWVFNIADASVCIAAGMIIAYLIKEMINEKKNENAAAAETDAADKADDLETLNTEEGAQKSDAE